VKKSNGRIWPYAIGLSITLVFGFCVGTIVVTQTADIQMSDSYMTNYQDVDAKANDIIKAEIAFDKKYNVSFDSKEISSDNSTLKYSVSDKNNNVVNSAELILAISRPETDKFNQLKVQVSDDYRFFNVKVDTRKNAQVDIRIKEAYEF